MAELIPNPFPLLNTPDMQRPGRQIDLKFIKNWKYIRSKMYSDLRASTFKN